MPARQGAVLRPAAMAMALAHSTVQKIRLLCLLVAASAAAGGLYSLLRADPGGPWPLQAAGGASIGAAISACILAFELFGAEAFLARQGRRLPLSAALALRALVYGCAILAALLLIPWVLFGRDPSPLRPGMAGDLAFAIAATLLFVAAMSVAQLIGPNTLGSLLLGRYYRPREEQRIVLFLDLVDSTGAAERIGDLRFHALLSEVFTRLSRLVADHGGEVYRYVGDAMIATWPLADPARNARAIGCLFACREALERAAPEFRRRYGEVPRFRAGMHAGPLVAGEIGGFKREIALLGDTMNTAARIEQACREAGHDLLVSQPLLDRSALPDGIHATALGPERLRGKAAKVEIFALRRGPPHGSHAAG